MLLKVIAFPFFLFRLCLMVFPSLVAIASAPTRKYQANFFSFLCLCGMLFMSLTFSSLPFSLNRPVSHPFQVTQQISTREVEQQLTQYLEIYQIQPTHRDILFNLSLLYSILGDVTTAAHYRNQAQFIDPNHGFFK